MTLNGDGLDDEGLLGEDLVLNLRQRFSSRRPVSGKET
jgi:hypothetical protein